MSERLNSAFRKFQCHTGSSKSHPQWETHDASRTLIKNWFFFGSFCLLTHVGDQRKTCKNELLKWHGECLALTLNRPFTIAREAAASISQTLNFVFACDDMLKQTGEISIGLCGHVCLSELRHCMEIYVTVSCHERVTNGSSEIPADQRWTETACDWTCDRD